LPRRNLFYRQDEVRTKSFAANLDQVLVLIAADPEFSERQLARALIATAAAEIPALIVLNKSDLLRPFTSAWGRLAPYRQMVYTVLPLCLTGATPDGEDSLAKLAKHLTGKSSLVLGPSGSGKSTLINRLVPGAKVVTGEVSTALNSGRHTTTSTTWYWMDEARNSALIDSPGFQEFGLRHIEPVQLAHMMPDLHAHTGECRFYNCTHLHEPGCGVLAAVKADGNDKSIHPNRYKIYSELHAELSQPQRY